MDNMININMTGKFCENCGAELATLELNECLGETITCSDCEEHAQWFDSGEIV